MQAEYYTMIASVRLEQPLNSQLLGSLSGGSIIVVLAC